MYSFQAAALGRVHIILYVNLLLITHDTPPTLRRTTTTTTASYLRCFLILLQSTQEIWQIM